MLRAVGAGVAAAGIAGCGGGDGGDGGGGDRDAGGGADTGPGVDAGPGLDAGPRPDAGAGNWATGGTAAMTMRDLYPNPFEGAGGSSCEVICSTTIGPCHVDQPLRADISEGWDGLPVRLALRLVDTACMPLVDAVVEVWHTNYLGVYSGRAASICNLAEADRAALYFRGYLRTDADGRVDFDTVFPGWYSGRAIHIHFRIMTGPYDPSDAAPSMVVSQLFFEDTLNTEIFANEPLYREEGQPDTTNGEDGVIARETMLGPYTLDVRRLPDGAMMASKTIVVREGGPGCRLGG